jgi:hypothetical protein
MQSTSHQIGEYTNICQPDVIFARDFSINDAVFNSEKSMVQLDLSVCVLLSILTSRR